jgi:hypothetical protein
MSRRVLVRKPSSVVTGGAASGTAEAHRGHPETRFRLKAAGRVGFVASIPAES